MKQDIVEDAWITKMANSEDGSMVSTKLTRSCNRHLDCEAAESEVMSRRNIRKSEIHHSFHCHDECCEECFGY